MARVSALPLALLVLPCFTPRPGPRLVSLCRVSRAWTIWRARCNTTALDERFHLRKAIHALVSEFVSRGHAAGSGAVAQRRDSDAQQSRESFFSDVAELAPQVGSV